MLTHDQTFDFLKAIAEILEKDKCYEWVSTGQETNYDHTNLEYYGLPYLVEITDKERYLLVWPQYEDVNGTAQIVGYKAMLLESKDDTRKVLPEEALDSNLFPKVILNAFSYDALKKAIENPDRYPEVAEFILTPVLKPWKASKITPIFMVICKEASFDLPEDEDEYTVVYYLDEVFGNRALYDEFMNEIKV